ncbi:Flagellar hook-associated protein 1 [Buchnera aphidicola (Protaphis terricola)]|uniref:FlgK family flagellar hook-associated protein n=1 Tax=Buchnera aphidicola TaxID=9 RepID=UPI003464A2FE
MSSILTSTIANIDAIKILIDNRTKKILHPKYKDLSERIAIENNVDQSNANPGVKVESIYDEYNNFIQEEKRKTNERIQEDETRIEEYSKLEKLFVEKVHVFNDIINELYSSIEDSIVKNNIHIFDAKIEKNLKKVIYELKMFDEKLNFLENDIKYSISEKIKQANILINKIYDLNINVQFFPVAQIPDGIYKYIDERDRLVDELNNILGVTVEKDSNNFKVYLKNGIYLINNNRKINLIALTSKTNDKYISIGYWNDDEKIIKKIEHMVPSASLGALFHFLKKDLKDAKNKLGQLTINFADSINENHTLGYDILGGVGKKIFYISQPKIISSSKNTSHPYTSVKWVSTSDAQDTNYIISMKDNHWIVKRLRDQTIVDPDIYQKDNNTYLTFDGIEFKIEGNENENNVYMIQPYADIFNELKLLIIEHVPFAMSSTNDKDQKNKNNAIIIYNLNKDKLVNKKDTLSQAYLKFLKSISYKCNDLEERLPFKRNMIRILENKKLSISDDINEDYKNLSYEQKCYIANVKVLKMAEKIFDDIVDCYS